MTIECDVLVVGAGPAGASAAYFLKHYDKSDSIKVDLVERLDTEKYKQYHDMCGEAVTEYLFNELLPLKPNGIVEKIRLIKEYYPGNIKIDTPVKGYILDRAQFLKSIIDEFRKKGGHFENASVKAFSQDNDKVKVKFEDKSRDYDYVIAADGANSMIRKSLSIIGRTRNFIQYIMDKKPESGVLEFFYDEKYKGDYKWAFPHEGKTKVGYPVLSKKIFKPKEKIIKKQSRAIGYGGVDKYVKGRILLVGDAACQTNAISKGGIRAGMVAGKLAAESVINKNPKLYEEKWKTYPYSSPLYLEGYEKLKEMGNEELVKLIKPFVSVDLTKKLDKLRVAMKTMFFYRKYLRLYRAYDLCDKWGW